MNLKQARRVWLLCVLAVLAFAVTAGAGVKAAGLGFFSGGSGTPGDPFLISNADDLVELATRVNSGDVFEDAGKAQRKFAQMNYRMTADIDLSGVGHWTPIGGAVSEDAATGIEPAIVDVEPIYMSFDGVFDGGNYAITNLVYSEDEADGREPLRYVGLFGYIDGADISNLALDVDIRRSDSALRDILFTGGLAGCVDSGSIENVGVSGVVYGGAAMAGAYTGGVVGQGDADNCSNAATVTGASVAISLNPSYTGGVVGQGSASDCTNVGAVTGGENAGDTDDPYFPACTYTGGVIGYGSAIECRNDGVVTGGKATGDGSFSYAGGIIGHTDTIENNENTGSVIGGEAAGNGSKSYAGGVVGYARILSTCVNIGAVTGGKAAGDDSASYAGGAAGNTADLSCSYSYGEVKGGEATGSSTFALAGGLVGSLTDTKFLANSYWFAEADGVNAGLPAGFVDGVDGMRGVAPIDSPDRAISIDKAAFAARETFNALEPEWVFAEDGVANPVWTYPETDGSRPRLIELAIDASTYRLVAEDGTQWTVVISAEADGTWRAAFSSDLVSFSASDIVNIAAFLRGATGGYVKILDADGKAITTVKTLLDLTGVFPGARFPTVEKGAIKKAASPNGRVEITAFASTEEDLKNVELLGLKWNTSSGVEYSQRFGTPLVVGSMTSAGGGSSGSGGSCDAGMGLAALALAAAGLALKRRK